MNRSGQNAIWREGDCWALGDAGDAVRLRDSKGLRYLALLVEHPGVEMHALDLAGTVAAPPADEPRLAPGDAAGLGGDDAHGAGPALDEPAKAAYRARIEDLREELEQATAWRDGERAARAHAELQALTDELARSVGLGGRDRPSASQAERARQNVGRALRKAVGRIAAASPALGAHLEQAVRTGTYCCYQPDSEAPLVLLDEPLAGAPPARAPGGSSHNMAVPLSSFIGRERELAELTATLQAARLVTVTGPGGSGKTRLALEVARPLADELPGGAWFVDLAPVFESGVALKAVARALGVRERPQVPLLDDVVERAGAAELLLVLDNCEHLVEECAELVTRLLERCPHLRVLVTSREPLAVPGELLRRVDPLETPNEGAPLEAVLRSEAVMLLMDRAQAALPGFELDPAAAPLAARICRRLDGLPLAIELGAARVATLSLHDLAAHLDDRFAVLTVGARTALPRQRTLEATVEWSYGLLAEEEQLLFDRLSVFAGGWTLEAAEEVCASRDFDPAHVAAGLGALVEKSLVVRHELPGGRVRYRLLETLRQYAWKRLEEHGERGSVRDSHLAWALRLAEKAEPHLNGLEQGLWLDRLEDELDNLRSAIDWAVESSDPASGLRIASIAIGGFWLWRGHVSDGERALARLLGHSVPSSDQARASGLLAAGRIAFQTGRWREGLRLCRESRHVWRGLGDPAGEARALIWQVVNEWGLGGGDDLSDLFDESVEVAARSGRAFEHALAAGLAAVWWADRDIARAVALADDAGRLIQTARSPNWLAHIGEFRAYVAFVAGRPDGARALIAEALPLYLEIGNRACGAHCLETAALVAAGTGRAETAAELLGTAGRLREELGTVPPAYEARVRRRGLDAIRARLDERSFAAARDRGWDGSFETAVEQAREAVR
ncbi:MAG TPA: AAA family ATPase [Thermoleophilaceae bacterium]|nr:AAA family ATPase [Thermoleophilaceae bacterium]